MDFVLFNNIVICMRGTRGTRAPALEIHIVIHPVIIGEGKKLMDDFPLPEKLNWKLVDTKVFKSGCVGLHYVKG